MLLPKSRDTLQTQGIWERSNLQAVFILKEATNFTEMGGKAHTIYTLQ